jgi:hypothetical protein
LCWNFIGDCNENVDGHYSYIDLSDM